MLSGEVLLLSQQTMPAFDGIYWVNLTSRILHILGAMILVGGFFYLRAIVMPSPAAAHATTADERLGGSRAKLAMWVGIATLLLLATGFWNFFQIVGTNDLARSYHMVFGLKFLAGLVLFLLAALVAGRSAAAETIRGNMRFWVSACILLGILAAALGSVLRSYPHNPKVDAPLEPILVAPANPTP